MLSGVFYYHFYFNFIHRNDNFETGKETNFSGVVIDEPKTSESSQSFTISLMPPLSGKIRIISGKSPEYDYGDALTLEGTIESAVSERDIPIAAFPKIKLEEKHQGFRPYESLLNFKKKLAEGFKRFLSSDAASLMGGLTFGIRSDFGKDFKNAMAQSGTTHLVALSGYNISILVLAISHALKGFLDRKMVFLIMALVIFLFVAMVGAEASVLRAAVMGFFALLAIETGRQYQILNAVSFAAALMVMLSPASFLTPGFALSFLSLLGIVYLGPLYAKLFKAKKDGGLFDFRGNLATSAAAQTAVLPILIISFNNFSAVGVLANALILPFVPFTMFLGFLMAGVNFIFPLFTYLISLLAQIILGYQIFVINFFAKLSFPISLPIPAAVFAIAYYSACVWFVISQNPSHKNGQ